MNAIASMIKTLELKLEERKEELEDQLTAAFKERQNKIRENMEALKEHHGKNEETKDNAEDLLRRYAIKQMISPSHNSYDAL